jgi:hypothetical protein
VFRTPKGYNLYVRGPANHCKDGVCPLDAIVETDWLASTFTMNWKVTRVNTSIFFGRGEPICMIFPEKRGELELFRPKIHFISEEPELERQYKKWSMGRYEFNQNLDANPAKPLWQKDYYAGRTPDGDAFVEHEVRLNVGEFIDRTRDKP